MEHLPSFAAGWHATPSTMTAIWHRGTVYFPGFLQVHREGAPPNPALRRTRPAATGSSSASSPRRCARAWCVFEHSTHPPTLEPVVLPELAPRPSSLFMSASWISLTMTRLTFRRLEPVSLCRSLHPFDMRSMPTAEDRSPGKPAGIPKNSPGDVGNMLDSRKFCD